jgi:hypothetical protein
MAEQNFSELVELMKENNRATGEIEADGRNTRRHLLEMKGLQTSAVETNKNLSTMFENFFENQNQSSLSTAEKDMERMSIFEEIRDQLRDGINTTDTSKDGKGGGAMLSKLGGMMGGAAMAAGALLAGVGIGAAGLTYAMKEFEDMDTKKIRENVDDLLSMAESDRMTVKNVGAVALTMTALGVGLAAFSLGEGAAKAVAKFESDADWTGAIKDNVDGLLSISDLENMNPKAVAGVGLTLGALGLGLAAFGVGKAADGVGEAISKFSSGDNFAKGIKDEVETLLSIKTEGFGKTAGLVGTLGGLGLGLAAFAVGKAGSGVADGLTKFTTGTNFADDIKSEVETLLSINTGEDGQVGDFVGTMGALAAGLVAFAIGKGANSTADAIDKFTEGDFAETIAQQVDTLLMIGDNASAERTLAATGTLTALGAGLAAFAAGKGLNTLADLGASIVGFFTGSKSPVEQAIEVGEKADQIEKGAIAFEKFLDVFQKFANMSTEIKLDTNIDEAIEQLDEHTRVLDTIVTGGKLTRGFNFETDGLANLTDDVDKAVSNINRIRDVLMLQSGGGQMASTDDKEGNKIITLSAENIELRLPEISTPGSTLAVADNSSRNTNTTTIVQTSPNNRVSDTLNNAYG